MNTYQNKIQKLESLCRALQEERKKTQQQSKHHDQQNEEKTGLNIIIHLHRITFDLALIMKKMFTN